MQINIDGTELVSAQKILETFGSAARPLIAKSLNRANRGTRTDASKNVRQEYNVKARRVKGSFTMQSASRRNLTAAARSSGEPISLHHFSPSPSQPGRRPRTGVSVKVAKSRKKITGSFLARMPNGGLGVFKRSGRSRLPIQKLRGPSVPQMLDHDNVLPEIESGAEDRFSKTLDQEIDHFLRKKGLR